MHEGRNTMSYEFENKIPIVKERRFQSWKL